MLEQLSWLVTIASGLAVFVSLIYAAIQIRQNTRALAVAAYGQVNASFADYAFQIARDRELSDLTLRAQKDFASVSEQERLRYVLSLLSFMRRAENVLFQTNTKVLSDAHWIGIRNSIVDVLDPPGAREAWATIRHRVNPDYAEWVDAQLSGAGDSPYAPPAS